MAQRARQYNDAVKIIRWPPEGITIVEVCPPENFRVSRLSQDASLLEEGYEQGRARAAEAIGKWMAT